MSIEILFFQEYGGYGDFEARPVENHIFHPKETNKRKLLVCSSPETKHKLQIPPLPRNIFVHEIVYVLGYLLFKTSRILELSSLDVRI